MSKDLTKVQDQVVMSMPAFTGDLSKFGSSGASAPTASTPETTTTLTSSPNTTVQNTGNNESSDESSDGTFEYVPTFSTSVSSSALMGGSALGLASLAILKQNQSLFEISLQSLKQSAQASEVATNFAESEWETSYESAQENYAAGMAQVGQEWTSCGIGFASAGATAGMMAFGDPFGTMKKAQQDEVAAKNLSKAMDEAPVNAELIHPRDKAVVGGTGGTATNIGHTEATPTNEEIADYDFKRKKVDAIKKDLKENGIISEATHAEYGPTVKGKFYGNSKGKIEATDPEVSVAINELRKDPDTTTISKIKAKQEDAVKEATNRYSGAQNSVMQWSNLIREISQVADNAGKAIWGAKQAVASKAAGYLSANAKLYGSISSQMFSAKDTWNNYDLKFFDQAMSVSQTDALRRANAVA